MPRLRFTIDAGDIARLQADLDPRQMEAAIFRSMNRSVITARKETAKFVRSKLNLKKKDYNRVIKAIKADSSILAASVWIGGEKRFGSSFFDKKEVGKFVRVKVYRQGFLKFDRAFIWKNIVLQRKGKKAYPLQEPVRELRIAMAKIVQPEATRISELFYQRFLEVLRHEIDVRQRGIV